jgi:hypothetical protein
LAAIHSNVCHNANANRVGLTSPSKDEGALIESHSRNGLFRVLRLRGGLPAEGYLKLGYLEEAAGASSLLSLLSQQRGRR